MAPGPVASLSGIDRLGQFDDPGSPSATGGGTHRLLIHGGTVAVAVQFEQRGRRAGFQTCVFGLGRGGGSGGSDVLPVVISAVDIQFGRRWELRSSGLWAEQTREQAFLHWSYGLEAFALAIDEPDELVRRGHGYRVPLGWELDFVAEADPEPVAPAAGDRSAAPGAFRQLGRIDGLLLTGDGERPITGRAERSFWPEARPAHSIPAKLEHRAASRPGAVVLPTLSGPWTVGPER